MSFLLFVFAASTLMHAYVVVRLGAVAALRGSTASAAAPAAWAIVALVVFCWLAFPVAPLVEGASRPLGLALELAGAVWFGTIFLVFTWTLAADVITGFGWLLQAQAGTVRRMGAVVGVGFGCVAVVQGVRPPVVRDVEVAIDGLRPEHDGLVITQITDLHLGELLGERWLEARVRQVEATRPSLIAVTGDVLNLPWQAAGLVPALRRLRAPLGVWAVTGNHEYYGGLEQALRIFHDAGFRALRDEAVEAAPGLVLAGVDDLTARRARGRPEEFVARALEARPAGATIFLCHSPWGVERAAAAGAALMLSGHTHDGQIWPFRYLVRVFYPRMAGRFEIGRMTLLVSRGTGFWGPPMRLFRRGEILRITLRRR